MKHINRKAILTIVCVCFISVGFLFVLPESSNSTVYAFFTLRATASSPEMLEYLQFIKQRLAYIGVHIDIFLCDCGDDWIPIEGGEYDIACIELNGMGNMESYLNDFYNENGSMNVFGYSSYMDYNYTIENGWNEWFLNRTNAINPDSQERYELCWEWQTYLLDKLLPCLPLFNEREYLLTYNNLEGLSFKNGLLQSWGKLIWNGMHLGQVFNDEVVIADNAWVDLNPVIMNYISSDVFIEDCIFDSLIKKDSDHTYWPHVAENWINHDNNHVSLIIRDNIKWQSDPESLFTEEYLDINDVYFSLYVYDMLHNLTWIKDYTILDENTIDLELDLDLLDYRNITFNYLDELSKIKILPEFYLNQSQLIDGITPDINHITWEIFSENPFGTSLMQFTNYIENVETLFYMFDDCWWLQTDTFDDIYLNWENRYGNFLNSPSKLRVRILDDMERVLEFSQGRIDLLHRSYNELLDFEMSQYDTIDMIKLSKPSYKYMVLAFNIRETRAQTGNLEPAPLYPGNTVGWAIRKAIAYAIDREEINNVLYGGRMDINNWPISPALGLWCNPDIGNYCYNLGWARGFMTVAGFDTCAPPDTSVNWDNFPDWDNGCNNTDYSTIELNLEYSYTLLITIGLLFLFKRNRKRGRLVK